MEHAQRGVDFLWRHLPRERLLYEGSEIKGLQFQVPLATCGLTPCILITLGSALIINKVRFPRQTPFCFFSPSSYWLTLITLKRHIFLEENLCHSMMVLVCVFKGTHWICKAPQLFPVNSCLPSPISPWPPFSPGVPCRNRWNSSEAPCSASHFWRNANASEAIQHEVSHSN